MILQRHTVDTATKAGLDQLREGFKKLPPDTYRILILNKRQSRSARQRKYFFGVLVKLLSDHCGYSKREMNEILKLKFNPKKVQQPDGSWIIYGGSIEEETVKRCEEIFAEIRQFGAEMDVNLPEPNEVPDEFLIEVDEEMEDTA